MCWCWKQRIPTEATRAIIGDVSVLCNGDVVRALRRYAQERGLVAADGSIVSDEALQRLFHLKPGARIPAGVLPYYVDLHCF